MCHILGVSGQWMTGSGDGDSWYYVSPQSNTPLTPAQIYATNPINAFQAMIISPNVLSYTQTLFGCNDGTTGALFQIPTDVNNNPVQDANGNAYPAGHWFDNLFYREMMLPFTATGGNRMTALTMNLFLDMGLYEEVEVTSFSDVSVHGSGRGCDFAQYNPT